MSFDSSIEQHAQNLLAWDYQLLPEAVPAALYVRWEEEIMRRAEEEFIPNIAKKIHLLFAVKTHNRLDSIPKKQSFKTEKYRNTFLKEAFESALLLLKNQLGDDPKEWGYGQVKFKHTALTHALGGITTPELAKKLNLGPLPKRRKCVHTRINRGMIVRVVAQVLE